jgi:formate hydrogenlyase subunit 3/multisubunit Na+/H+ antiporter MnhD subunit
LRKNKNIYIASINFYFLRCIGIGFLKNIKKPSAMKLLAFICNVALLGFTGLVIMTDGMSRQAVYVVFTLWLLLVPIFNMVVLWRSGLVPGWTGFPGKEKSQEEKKSTDSPSFISPAMKITAVICNVILLGSLVWVYVDQYPHPKEEGFIAYILVVLLTPVLSSVAILLGRVKKGQIQFHSC